MYTPNLKLYGMLLPKDLGSSKPMGIRPCKFASELVQDPNIYFTIEKRMLKIRKLIVESYSDSNLKHLKK